MRICKFILSSLLCFISLQSHGEIYRYVKGLTTFEIAETSKEYQVNCIRSTGGITSRNKNITDRQLRMDAVDLIGAYILYKESALSKRLGSAYFQIYVEGLNLHYQATLTGVRQTDKVIDGKAITCYCCEKNAYQINYASYNSNLNIQSLLTNHYQKNKNEESAFLIYNYEDFTSEQYIAMQRDYLTGCVQMPPDIRKLQGIVDRFELSILSPYANNLVSMYKAAKNSPPQVNPFRQFYYEELITSAPLKDKKAEYENWKKIIDVNGCIYESILDFCYRKCRQPIPSETEATLTSVIEAFPGAISPFGIRYPPDNVSFNAASQAYSKSDFAESARILKEAIDTEGLTPDMLNLLGASYRFLNQPEKAMPYLLLCLTLNPNTQYLAGNIFLCMKHLGFSKTDKLVEFCHLFAIDPWSKASLADGKE